MPLFRLRASEDRNSPRPVLPPRAPSPAPSPALCGLRLLRPRRPAALLGPRSQPVAASPIAPAEDRSAPAFLVLRAPLACRAPRPLAPVPPAGDEASGRRAAIGALNAFLGQWQRLPGFAAGFPAARRPQLLAQLEPAQAREVHRFLAGQACCQFVWRLDQGRPCRLKDICAPCGKRQKQAGADEARRIGAVLTALLDDVDFLACACAEIAWALSYQGCRDQGAYLLSRLEVLQLSLRPACAPTSGSLRTAAQLLLRLDALDAWRRRQRPMLRGDELGMAVLLHNEMVACAGADLLKPVVLLHQAQYEFDLPKEMRALAQLKVFSRIDEAKLAAFLAHWPPWLAFARAEQVRAFVAEPDGERRVCFAPAEEPTCPLSQVLASRLTDPICREVRGVIEVYDRAMLLQWWQLTGRDVFNRQVASLADLGLFKPHLGRIEVC